MNGFSTKRFFDSEQLKKGMLLTATFKDGAVNSGLISNVTPENVQFTYWDAENDSFQEQNVTIEQVENGTVVVTFATHLTDFISKQSEKTERPSETKASNKNLQKELFDKFFGKQAQTSENKTDNSIENTPLDELLKKNFSQEALESFLKKQRDEAVIAFILSRLSLSQKDFAKLLFTLPDAISLNVQKQMDALKELNSDSLKSLEETVNQLVRDFLRNQSQERPQNPFSFGGGVNPFGDMFGDLLGDLLNKKGNKPTDKLDDITSQFEDIFRKFFDDNNKKF